MPANGRWDLIRRLKVNNQRVDTACLNVPAAKTTKTPRYLEEGFQIGYF